MKAWLKMRENEGRSNSTLFCFLGFLLLAVAVALSLNCARLYIWPTFGRFGDAEMGRFLVTVATLIAVPVATVSGTILLHFGIRSHRLRRLRLLGWLLTGVTTVAILIPLCAVTYSMRPIPKYDPNDYQHLVGKTLQAARSELDCKHSVSGSGSGNGVSYRFLSLRGMEIVATPDGVITEVKKGRRD